MNCFGLLSSSYSKQMREFAVQLGAVATQYDDCIASADSARKVEGFLAEGKTLGVSSTPTVFVNGRRIPGAVSIDTLRGLILNEAKLVKRYPAQHVSSSQ
jgi:protein-disulfide isomerase